MFGSFDQESGRSSIAPLFPVAAVEKLDQIVGLFDRHVDQRDADLDNRQSREHIDDVPCAFRSLLNVIALSHGCERRLAGAGEVSAFSRLSLVWASGMRKQFPPGLIKRLKQWDKGAGQSWVGGKIQHAVQMPAIVFGTQQLPYRVGNRLPLSCVKLCHVRGSSSFSPKLSRSEMVPAILFECDWPLVARGFSLARSRQPGRGFRHGADLRHGPAAKAVFFTSSSPQKIVSSTEPEIDCGRPLLTGPQPPISNVCD
ncbi:hypothetical protein [Mesorhizobium sp.]|uniref:hypothetical protein n=1 Tax=Mesorhizobium sp. TaxID=1871066 RepID=UPI00257F12FD|nr:hypothetical protein [Mesorhizobium sp.]